MLFEKGASYDTLNTGRSAISLISVRDLSKDKLISRFLKGVYRERLTKSRYLVTYLGTSILFSITYKRMRPMSELKLKEVTEKATTINADER